MREFFKNRYKDFKSDYIQYASCTISAVLLFFHVWQFVDSGFLIQPLIRVIFCSALIPCVFVFGRDALFWGFLIFAYAITFNITFFNYTPFIIITLFLMIKMQNPTLSKNLKLFVPVISVYVLCILIVCKLHDKDSTHLTIHFINCFVIFFVTWHFVRRKQSKKPLILDDDQKRILHDLCHGKMQKEIEYFSKNTITEKIKAAIVENELFTREQLMMRFMMLNEEYC